MTPNFALSLSLEGLRLLHRAPAGWTRIGEVPLDSADLAGDLTRLRAVALARAPEGLRTKLLIPNDQIRYLVLEGVLGADEVAKALEGTTPYAVDELAIDYVVEDGCTYVAAVARETLEEAEGFAREHALEPVAFAAVPESDGFPGEVLFGPVEGLKETVTRDEVAVHELPPEAQGDPLEITEMDSVVSDASFDAEPPISEDDLPPAPMPAQPPAGAAEAGTGPEADASEQEMAAIDTPASEIEAGDEMTAPQSEPLDTQLEAPNEEVSRHRDQTSPASVTPAADLEDEDEALLAPAPDTTAPRPAEPLPQAGAPVMPDLPMPDQSGIDDDEAMLAEPAHREPPRPAAPPAAPPLPPRGDAARDKATPPRTDESADAARRIMPPAMPRPGAPPAAMPAMPPATPGESQETEENAEAAALAAGASLVAPEASAEAPQPATTPRAEPGSRRSVDLASERERMTVFGARRATPDKRPGRLALIAGAIVTALLVLLFGFWLSAAEDDPQAGLLRDTSADLAALTPDEPEAAPADTQEPEAAVAVPEQPAPEPVPDYNDYPAPDRGPAAAVSPAEAERVYAATGVWLRAPRLPLTPRAEQLGMPVAVTSEAVAEFGMDGLRLAAVAPDGGLPVQAVPPPAGSVFERDARGFIAATAEGTVTPQGLVVYEGRPEVLPPTRPGTVAPPTGTPAEESEASEAEAREDDSAARVDPATTPEARPEGVELIPGAPPVVPPTRPGTTTSETNETDAAGVTPGGVALDALRPTRRPEDAELPPLAAYEGPRPPLRPEGLAPDAESQVTEATDAQAAALAEAVGESPSPPARASVADALASLMADAPDPLANATPQAVPTARRPDSRPRNFDRVVAQSRSRAPAATASATASAPQQVANATVAPDGPVPGSVARAATRDNAINLRDINLIGVYGKPGARRALIRMENGRYLRVGVGDALDGGKVTAIGDDVLNYVRRGRTMVLKIPD